MDERKNDPALPVGEAEVTAALATLAAYRRGKANLERRVVEDERWYQLRHWDVIGAPRDGERPRPASAWLFNAILNKHADAMDNFPQIDVLAREPSDEPDAKLLSAVLPVILERCDFEGTYSRGWWEKLKHGTAVYAPLWNSELENGLGDVEVGLVDLLNIFWEPGIGDIQKSRNLFVVDLRDNDLLEEEYPQLAGRLGGGGQGEIPEYVCDDGADLSGKTAVVDWYYKRRRPEGGSVLHYAKICAGQLLYASENDPALAGRGWYDHGQYPFVFDTLFPEKGTPVGFGYVALCKNPQLYIDKLSQIMLENAMMSGKKRFFIGANTGVNEAEFLDWASPLVHVEGANNLDEAHIREIETTPLDGVFLRVLQMKIDEMKETAANRDVSQGSAGAGVTAAAAITALQEAGNKSSRDMIAGSYRAYARLDGLIIELIRQFYSQSRSFRILGPGPESGFTHYSNAGLQDQVVGRDSAGSALVRRPVFDVKLQTRKRNPVSQAGQNELGQALYAAGFFDPQRAEEALVALEVMDFPGKERVERALRANLEAREGAAATPPAPAKPRGDAAERPAPGEAKPQGAAKAPSSPTSSQGSAEKTPSSPTSPKRAAEKTPASPTVSRARTEREPATQEVRR